MATIAPIGQIIRIVHANAAACRLRIRPGQTLADAKSIVPQLVTHDDDPQADRREIESLAVWADCLSPVVQIESSDTLLVDVTGCERLFGGEDNLLRRAVEGVLARGFSAVRAAIADAPGAAWAVAHAHSEAAVVVPPGQSAAYLSPLPVWSLRIEPKTVAALALVGVETVRALLYLPRSSLVSRFGAEVLERIDQALGDLPEPMTAYQPPRALGRRVQLGAPTTRLDLLTEAVTRAVERFCDSLDRQVAGVRQAYVTFHCPYVDTPLGSQSRTVTMEVNLSAPTRCARHLRSLLVVLLDSLRLPAPADAVTVWARWLDPLDGWQGELFATDARDARELADLLDRLVARLGPAAVARLELLSDHEPERAFRYVPIASSQAVGSRRAGQGGGSYALSEGGMPKPESRRISGFGRRHVAQRPGAAGHGGARVCAPSEAIAKDASLAMPHDLRPLRLLWRPIEIGATSIVPEGPPIAFRLDGVQHTVVDSAGPERIETGWWRGPHVKRDYYRVVTQEGRRCWIFRNRDTERWYLHGWFD